MSVKDVNLFETAVAEPLDALVKSAEERMNSGCFCVSLDQQELKDALKLQLGSTNLAELVEERCPYLFSSMPVFISDRQRQQMQAAVNAIESVIALPAYREHVLAKAPPIAQHDPGGCKGVFFGYDFHLSGDAVGLIEINTNAGGALLNALMARAHRACSINTEQLAEAAASGPNFEQDIVDMFRTEWALSNRAGPLTSIAIVDVDPEQQYLYPEFLLFKQLFERHGITAVIADPSGLSLRDGILWSGELALDLVYNRLTDFLLELPASSTLRDAYLARAVVLTPHPQAHALFADKRNLALLSDRSELQRIGVPVHDQETILAAVLPTILVDPADGERLWRSRRRLFFKPSAGFGGRAAYRGDKLTKRVWSDILAGDYVAQTIMAPGERVTGSQQQSEALKFDLRLYTYGRQVQWIAARMYQGQTTNFRTPGGGFAPVYSLPAVPTPCGAACSSPAPGNAPV